MRFSCILDTKLVWTAVALCMLSGGFVARALPAEDEPTRYEPITVVGKTVDTNGKPIAGATVYLACYRQEYRLLGQTTSDQNGEYQFQAVELPIKRAARPGAYDSGVLEVFGTAKGFGFTWNAQQWVYPDRMPSVARLDKTELAGGPGRFPAQQPIRQDLVNKVVPADMHSRVTDEEGRFSFDELPSDAEFRIFVKPINFAHRAIYATTAAPEQYRFKDLKIETDGTQLVFAKVRSVPISVIYGDTGKPAKNVRVELSNRRAHQSQITDPQGRLQLQLPPGQYKVGYLVEYGTPYISRYSRQSILSHTVANADDPHPLLIKLEPAAQLDIEIVDAHLGKPIEGVDIWVDGGDFRGDYSWRSWLPPNVSMVDRPRSDKTGKMRVFFEPGSYIIAAGNQFAPANYEDRGQSVKLELEASDRKSLKLQLSRRLVKQRAD